MDPSAINPQPTSLGSRLQLRGWLEILAIILLLEAGGIAGSLTGLIPASAICSVLLPLIAATFFLLRQGLGWRDVAFPQSLSAAGVVGWSAIALVAAIGLSILTRVIISAAGLPSVDYSAFIQLVEGELVIYLWMLIPVSWGSAAIGEELLVRGFLQHRLTGLTGRIAAIVLQALIFAVAHFYQGLSGVIGVFVIGLVFGTVFYRCRNILPLIIAHGVIDTIAMTTIFLGYGEILNG